MDYDVALVPNDGWDERVLVIECGELVNVFAIITERYLVLVDTLFNEATARAMLAIAEPYAPGRQLLVVNTHSHFDHAWGNQLFTGPNAARPAPVLGTRGCAELLRSAAAETKLRGMQEREPQTYRDVRLVPPDVLFDERLVIDGGDLTLELFLTPGHAPDHVAVWIPEIRTLLPGDAAEAPFPFVESAATMPHLRDSLARMAALDAATVLYCHAPTPAGPALIRHNIAYFDELERRCRAAIDAGVSPHVPDDADVESLTSFPFADAIPPRYVVAQPEFYQPGHRANLRAMLAHLAGEERSDV